MLYLKDWRVCTPPGFSLGFEGDNLAVTLALDTDLPEGWDLKLDVEKEGKKNIIQLERSGQVYSVQLTSSMLASGGLYLLQVRGTLGEQIRHSNQFYAAVHHSINAVDAFPPSLPSEFEQMEDRLTDINNHPPGRVQTAFGRSTTLTLGNMYHPTSPCRMGAAGLDMLLATA